MTDSSILSNILNRNEYGTAMACSLINGLMLYCYGRGSIMFICSLDAENTPTHYGMIACSTLLAKSNGRFFFRTIFPTSVTLRSTNFCSNKLDIRYFSFYKL